MKKYFKLFLFLTLWILSSSRSDADVMDVTVTATPSSLNFTQVNGIDGPVSLNVTINAVSTVVLKSALFNPVIENDVDGNFKLTFTDCGPLGNPAPRISHCTLTITFDSKGTLVAKTANLHVGFSWTENNGKIFSQVKNISLEGIGVVSPTLTITPNPTSLDFGKQEINHASAPQPIKFTVTADKNMENSAFQVAITGNNKDLFIAEVGNCNTLPTGVSSFECTIETTFTPTSEEVIDASKNQIRATFTGSNYLPQNAVVSLGGTGTTSANPGNSRGSGGGSEDGSGSSGGENNNGNTGGDNSNAGGGGCSILSSEISFGFGLMILLWLVPLIYIRFKRVKQRNNFLR